MKTYKTAQVAKAVGVHPNTVRLYEELHLIPKAERTAKGYRVFTDFHIRVFKLAQTAFQIEVLQNGLRKKIVETVKLAAKGQFDAAMLLVEDYLQQVEQEVKNAKEAIGLAEEILSGLEGGNEPMLKRQETAELLDISMDTLRNWEMNGLLRVKRLENGYRVYTGEDIRRLKMIRSLRCADYSLEAILRMLTEISDNPGVNIEAVLNTPRENEDIISVYDQLLSSLQAARENAEKIKQMLTEMKNKY